MSEAKIIYSKSYPRERVYEDIDILGFNDREKISEFNALSEKFENIEYQLFPIPEHLAYKNDYIKGCIIFSEEKKIDLIISELSYGLFVCFRFEDPVCFKEMTNIFSISDEITVLTEDTPFGSNTCIILEYSTHEKIISAK